MYFPKPLDMPREHNRFGDAQSGIPKTAHCMELLSKLPKALQAHQKKLAATAKPFIKISLGAGPPAYPWQSRLGGTPWWPREEAWPVNADGIQLFFLAQLNFSEMPALEGFPREGLLQIFIFDDYLYGQNPDDSFAQDTFRVIYRPEIHHNIDALLHDFSFLRSYRYDDLPIEPTTAFSMAFQLSEGFMPADDCGFETQMGKDFFAQFGASEWALQDAWQRIAAAQGHKVGAYPHFAQYDPRPTGSDLALLLQFDSEPKKGFSWGDMGTAQFFAPAAKLRQGDFSEVGFFWDGY